MRSLHVISGRWKGRKIDPVSAPDLMPTKGFVREVLFNWLRDDLEQSRVLDCFAGSGALGIEAVSRGARSAELWEIHPSLARWLAKLCRQLDSSRLKVYAHDAYRSPPLGQECDIVLLDPPFSHPIGEVGKLLKLLIDHRRIRCGAKVYLEQRRSQKPIRLGDAFHRIKCRGSRGVLISLWSYQT